MEEFRVAGSTSGEADERLLDQVVRIAGYTSTIKELVNKNFSYCRVHGTLVPREPGRRQSHAACTHRDDPVKRASARPIPTRASLPGTRSS